MSERIYLKNEDTEGQWIDIKNSLFSDIAGRAFDQSMREALMEEIENADELLSEDQYDEQYGDEDADEDDE